MRKRAFLTCVCVLVLANYAFAVETWHIWDRTTQGEYTSSANAAGTMFVKGPGQSPINSPLHESWNLTDEYIGGVLNPHFIGDTLNAHEGLFYRFIFYNGTLNIDTGAKVGFWEKMFASGNVAGQAGILNVTGHLFGPEIRPWKSGCPMTLNVMDDGLLEVSNILRIGIADTGDNMGYFNLSGGLAKVNNLAIYGASSYIDITGGELLILNSNWSVDAVNTAILAGDILNTSGEGLNVMTKDVGGVLYTSVTLVPEPATMLILGFGSCLALLRRK